MSKTTHVNEGKVGNPTSNHDDPPGAVSNQNREEAQSELRDDQTHPEPRSRDNSSGAGEGSKPSSSHD